MKPQLLQGAVFSIPHGIDNQEIKDYIETWVSPFLALAYDFQDIPFFFYISGSILEQLDTSFKACRDVLLELVERKQVELLNGFYYDSAPLLQVKEDQRDQLEKHSHYIRKNYKYQGHGLWVTPGTYDNSLIPSLKKNGIQYLFAERAYLESLSSTFSFGLAEELGNTVCVLPYNKAVLHSVLEENKIASLIDNIFFDTALQELQEIKLNVLFVESHDVVDKIKFFKNMSNFENQILENNMQEHCVLPQQVYKTPDTTLCRIRTTTYGDEENESFVKQLLYKAESRLLYGYLQHYITKINKYKKDKVRKQSAKLLLAENQSHYPFWSLNRPWGIHDVKVRQNAYKNFVSIEKSLQKVGEPRKSRETQFLHTDINLDGKKEFLISTPSFTSIVETTNGSLCMLQRVIRSKVWNYCCGYFPGYFEKDFDIQSVEKRNVENHNVYPPWSFREILIPEGENSAEVHANIVKNRRTLKPISFEKAISNKELSSLILTQNAVPIQNDTNDNDLVHIEKNYIFKGNSLQIQYRVTNDFSEQKTIQLGIELNMSLTHDIDYMSIVNNFDSKVEKPLAVNMIHNLNTSKLRFINNALKEQVNLEMPIGAKVHLAPVYYSLSDSEEDFYQHTNILIVLPVTVSEFSYEERSISLSFAPIVSPSQNTTDKIKKT